MASIKHPEHEVRAQWGEVIHRSRLKVNFDDGPTKLHDRLFYVYSQFSLYFFFFSSSSSSSFAGLMGSKTREPELLDFKNST